MRGNSALFRLVVRNGFRTSSGKFLCVESCYPESFGFLRLWLSHNSCLPQLLEEMREDCDGRHSIELLDENCDEDNDDLHKILALSNPFRRIDGE